MSWPRSWPKSIALGVLDLAAKEGRRHLVGFVADDEVPVGIGQLCLNVLVAAQLIQTADGHRFSANQLPVRADSSLSFVRISKGS